ncbi:hypothetical protein Y032_0022g575 [Ancylostoma ceylanicum]|uniref:Uncharacterized protein n=1 Tax=Ancylostoma ceylanicum TaxID=53326 RepID=A0A016UY28_9BILA|nr:hypothetical protein Y032_0022g575 [Ancylostoma ceylanicum]
MRLDEYVKSSLQRKLVGEFLQEGIPGDVHTSFPLPSRPGIPPGRGWSGIGDSRGEICIRLQEPLAENIPRLR